MLEKILHYLWFRRENIYSFYKSVVNNPKTNIDGRLSFEEFSEYIDLYKNSGATKESFDDNNIISGSIVGGNILENTSKNLIENQQGPIDCVPRALIRSVRFNSDIELTQEKEQEYIDEMYIIGIISGTGSKVSTVQQWLRQRLEKDFGRKYVYFKEFYNSTKYNELISKGYSHAMGGAISKEYVADFLHDGDIDIGNYDFQETIDYWHVFMYLPEGNDTRGNIVENYVNSFGAKNIYRNDHIRTFANKGYFFSYAYFLVEEVSVDVHKERLLEEKKQILEQQAIKELTNRNIQVSSIELNYFVQYLDLLREGKIKPSFYSNLSKMKEDERVGFMLANMYVTGLLKNFKRA